MPLRFRSAPTEQWYVSKPIYLYEKYSVAAASNDRFQVNGTVWETEGGEAQYIVTPLTAFSCLQYTAPSKMY